MSVMVTKTQFTATDGYSLSGRHYQGKTPKAMLVIASATGVPQGFYRQFAEYAAEQDFDVFTFDYRGIGESKPEQLKGFDMDYRDWAQKDLQAVLETIHDASLPLFLVGHSYGGHAVGMLANHSLLTAACFFGAGAGWHGWMPKMERVKVQIMWNVIAPVLTRVRGYLGWSALGMGEDLPMGVYRQWKRWCKHPHYFFDDPDYQEMHQLFSTVTLPIKAVTATDDKWAMPESRDAFIKHYTGSELDRMDVSPNDIGSQHIGHMGYFRPQAAKLWPHALDFFLQHN